MCRGALNCPGKETGLITGYIYPAFIPVGLWPLQYPRSPVLSDLTPTFSPAKLLGCLREEEEREEGIS